MWTIIKCVLSLGVLLFELYGVYNFLLTRNLISENENEEFEKYLKSARSKLTLLMILIFVIWTLLLTII